MDKKCELPECGKMMYNVNARKRFCGGTYEKGSCSFIQRQRASAILQKAWYVKNKDKVKAKSKRAIIYASRGTKIAFDYLSY